LVLKENSSTNGVYFSGGYLFKSGCFSENHIYKTEESDWLIADNNSDDTLSGTLYVDNLKYVYHGSSVTVYDGNKQGTFTQSELRAELNSQINSTTCE